MKLIKILMMAALSILSVSVFAQDSTKVTIKTPEEKAVKMKYSCPMHPDMMGKKHDKCSQCGMEMSKSKMSHMKMEAMKSYSCPMHPDVVSDKPGKCSKCGMDLKETAKTSKTYSCPMHPDVVSDKPGKCSKCGMDLKEKEIQTIVYSCPMKCEGDKTYDKPGKCPICGMNLKEKKDDHTNHHH